MDLSFELTIQETNVVMASLAKQPYEVVAPVIAKIQGQAQPQVQAAHAAGKIDAEGNDITPKE